MNTQFVRDRISMLRVKKDVSEYQMSLDLGHSKGYIQSISSGKSMPSLTEFLSICDYLNITPRDFFNLESEDPILLRQLYINSSSLPSEDLELLVNMSIRLSIDREKKLKQTTSTDQ